MSDGPARGDRGPGRNTRAAELFAAATAVLAATVDVLRSDEPLSVTEIGDDTDLVAEVADALAALSDRLARDLDAESAPGPSTSDDAVRGLRTVRDGLAEASSNARRCAAALYRARYGPTS